jgi:hypothetical protein
MAEKQQPDKIDASLMTIVAAVLSVVMICSFAIPVITGTAGLGALSAANLSKYGGLIELIIIVLIFGLIIPIIRGYNSNKR